MSDHAKHRQPQSPSQRRFTLRTLFFVSIAIAAPFLLLANLRNAARPDDSLASPLYLLAGVAGVLFSAAIGNALAGRSGMIVTAIAAGLVWILLVALLSEFSDMLTQQLPVHIVAVIATIAGLAALVHRHRESTDDTPHEHLVRLIEVKKQLQEAGAQSHAPQAHSTEAAGEQHPS